MANRIASLILSASMLSGYLASSIPAAGAAKLPSKFDFDQARLQAARIQAEAKSQMALLDKIKKNTRKHNYYEALTLCQNALSCSPDAAQVYSARAGACIELAASLRHKLNAYRTSPGHVLTPVSEHMTFGENLHLKLLQHCPVCMTGLKTALDDLRGQLESQQSGLSGAIGSSETSGTFAPMSHSSISSPVLQYPSVQSPEKPSLLKSSLTLPIRVSVGALDLGFCAGFGLYTRLNNRKHSKQRQLGSAIRTLENSQDKPSRKEYKTELKAFNWAIGKTKLPRYFLKRAELYQKCENYKLAINDYTRVIAISGLGSCASAIAHAKRAVCYDALNQHDKAAADIKYLVEENELNSKMSMAALAPLDQADSEKARQLLNKTIKATGKLPDDKGYRICSEITLNKNQYDQVGPIKQFHMVTLSKGDKWRQNFIGRGTPLEKGFDGKQAWRKSGDHLRVMPPNSLKLTVERDSHSLLSSLEEAKKRQLRLLESARINGQDCPGFVVSIPNKEHSQTAFWIDPVSSLVARKQYELVDPVSGMSAVTCIDYGDYHRVDGKMVPFQRSVDSNYTETVRSMTNESLSDEDLAMPRSEKEKLATPISIPFKFKKRQVTIECKVNGRKRKLLIDTGAWTSYVNKSWARGGQLTELDPSSGKRTKQPNTTLLSSLSLGHHKIKNLWIDRLDLPGGLLGMDVLGQYRIELDFQHKRIVLSDPNLQPSAENSRGSMSAEQASLPLSWSYGRPVISGLLDDHNKMAFLVDVGATCTTIPFRSSEHFGSDYGGSISYVRDFIGRLWDTGSVKASKLALGSETIANPKLTFRITPEPFLDKEYGLLGTDNLSKFKKVIIDPGRELLTLLR